MEYRHTSGGVSNLNYHLVFCPKYRLPVLVGEVAAELEALLREKAGELDVEVNHLAIKPDHVHLFVKAPPILSPAKLAHQFKKTANQRRDFHHKQARKLVDAHNLITHEALNIKGIARTRLAKSTHDAGWAQFVDILGQKAEEAAVRVIAVDPRNTTQACSSCGALSAKVKKTLSDRTHSCSCGYVADRDVNAARNILHLGLGLSLRDGTQRVAASVSREAVCFS